MKTTCVHQKLIVDLESTIKNICWLKKNRIKNKYLHVKNESLLISDS